MYHFKLAFFITEINLPMNNIGKILFFMITYYSYIVIELSSKKFIGIIQY